MTGQEWANFDARQHDAQQQEMSYQSPGMVSSNPLHPLVRANENMTNSIRDTFRRVTLNHHGTRNVREGIVSEKSGTPSPEKPATMAGTEPLENVNLHRGAQEAGDLLEFREVARVEYLNDTSSMQQSQIESTAPFTNQTSNDGDQVDGSIRRRSRASNGDSPFNNAGQVRISAGQPVNHDILGQNLGAIADADEVYVEEDRPEWESSSTVCDSGNGTADAYDLYDAYAQSDGFVLGEDDLIDF
jgi:hypothetical protein